MTPHWHARAWARGEGRAHDLPTLLRRSSAGDPRARETVILRFLPLARRLARCYEGRGEPLEDLVQAANVGLVQAVDRYSPQRGDAFPAYARPMILGEIRRHFRDTTWRVHVPRPLQERAGRVARAEKEFASSAGARANVETVARYLDLKPQEVTEAQHVLTACWPDSLDAPPPARDGIGLPRYEVLASPESEYEAVEVSIGIGRALREFARRDQTVFLLRHCCELSQNEIASRVGVSQMHVSRILRATNAAVSAACGLGGQISRA
jgi:RNA polymerase sigma-B factor